MRNKLRKPYAGFTLLELLIVISIIGILVTVAAASYTSAQKKARDSRRMSDMKAIQNAAEQYYSEENARYPAAGTQADFTTTAGVVLLPAGYPADPKPANPAYTFSQPDGTTATYCACATLEGNAGNSTANDCSAFAAAGGFYCVRNLQ